MEDNKIVKQMVPQGRLKVKAKRTEEIDDIIERMPGTFPMYITYLISIILVLLLTFGYFIKYPDVITGEMTISAEQSPLQLVAEQNGKLKLMNLDPYDQVRTGQTLAWIENPARPELIEEIERLTDSVAFPITNAKRLYEKLPKNFNLGDLTLPYSSFLSAIKQMADYQELHLYDKQEQSLLDILNEQQNALKTLKDKEGLSVDNLKLIGRLLERDSILLKKKIISQQEFEQSVSSRISAEDQVKNSLRNSGSIREQISSTMSSIQQNKISRSEKVVQLELESMTSFNNLMDKINLWKKAYLIYSPIEGKVQFLKFWRENQFIQAGEPIFTIVPIQSKIKGKLTIPLAGAGKVEIGQQVIVKLADFPYMEYGYIKAIVKDIALVSSQMNLGDGKISDSYLINVDFPKGLETNYGSKLNYKSEAKGTAEVITKDRRLIERFFDNLKYISNKN